jgi:peroxiredoxin Q/BCP
VETVIIGISTDTLELQQKFTDKEKLNFPLLADNEAKVAKAFGVLKGKVAGRSTFIIDKKGTVKKVYDPVGNAKDHPEEVLKYVKENLK